MKELNEYDRLPGWSKIKVVHDAGFFSCCSVKLTKIIEFFNQNGFPPDFVDGSELLGKYKDGEKDVTSVFFKEPSVANFKKCYFNFDTQFGKYEEIEFDSVCNFVKAYFSVSDYVNFIVEELKEKYGLEFQNLCSVFYRGNDKCGETMLGSHEEFFTQANNVLKKNDVKFLVQTDEQEFLQEFKRKYQNSLFFSENPLINNSPGLAVHDTIPASERKKCAAYFLASTIIVSQCKYLITHSGNCGLWAILYRGGVKNTYQYLNHGNFKGWIINE